MKKLTEDKVYVLIDNQPDCDRAIDILTKAGEKIWKDSTAFLLKEDKRYLKTYEDMDWGISYDNEDRTQVTLDELERILMPKKQLTKEDLPIGTKVVPHNKTIGKSFEDWEKANRDNEYVKVNRHDSKGYLVCDFEHFNYSDVTLYVEQPKINKAELMERIEKLEKKLADLEEKSKVTVAYPPTWANDPSTVIGKGTIEIEEEEPLDKITGVNESVEALKKMLLRKGVLTEHDFMSYIIDKHNIQAPTISDCKPAEKPAFEVGKVYKGNKIMFYCTKVKDERPLGFGFGQNGEWEEEDGFSWFSANITEATPEEWFNRLDKEYNKRGFKKGVLVNSSKLHGCKLSNTRIEIDSLYLRELNILALQESHNDSKWYEIMKDGKWAEIIEEPQYKEGTLGAFWDGEWEDAVCKRIAYLGTLEGKTKCDQFILKEANMCYLNFKPLKFD